MKLSALKNVLGENPEKRINVIFPDGDPIEPDFHVTEVGHVVRNFIDCGGAKRRAEKCVLQTWVAANDKAHRLTAGKLGRILEKATDVIPSDELPVELEYEGCNVVQYPVDMFEVADEEVRLILGKNHTDCLAKEACGVATACAPGAGCC